MAIIPRTLHPTASTPCKTAPPAAKSGRIGWIDYAKGLSILLVVQLNANVGLAQKVGFETWGNAIADFCVTFRMPLFFLVAGLFLARSITLDWRTYLDRKVLHFAYFYALWVTIKFIVKAPQISGGDPMLWLTQYVTAFVQPLDSLWFIYMLGIFFVVTRLMQVLPMPVLWVGAALLQMAQIDTGAILIDQFAHRYVFFLTGYMVTDSIFAIARLAAPRPIWAIVAALGFGLINGLVFMSGTIAVPGVTLGLGLIGAFSLVALLATLAEHGRLRFLGFCGARSLPIYLAFFFFVAVSRTVGLKILGDAPLVVDILAIAVPVAGVVGALMLSWLAPMLGAPWLFERPTWARLSKKGSIGKKARLSPAH